MWQDLVNLNGAPVPIECYLKFPQSSILLIEQDSKCGVATNSSSAAAFAGKVYLELARGGVH